MKKITLLICMLSSVLLCAQYNENAPWMKELNSKQKQTGQKPTFKEVQQAFENYWLTHDKDEKGRSLLHYAAGNGRAAMVRYLNGSGLDLNCVDNNGSTLYNVMLDYYEAKVISASNEISELGKLKLLQSLDNWSYRIIGLGFPFLTIGIISGGVWANEAWGSYWSWDPKETWALITWLVFATYLHARITKGWEGKKTAVLGGLGFFVIWICYLGVNFLGKGLHSYGWLS